MSSLTHLQLNLEIATYNKLLETGRTDIVAVQLLERIQKQITMLERRLKHEESRCKKAQHKRASGLVRYGKEAWNRFRTNYNGYIRTISSVLESPALQAKEGSR